ncbi:MAG: diacylglycerol kinase [Treponema sp.]|nr:diacylglycerol kinase [Treponema sp.]
MKNQAKLQEFGSILSEILVRSLVSPGPPLRWTIIANPGAGGFTINRRWKKHIAVLNSILEKAGHNPIRKNTAPSLYSQGWSKKTGLIPTSGPGHALKIAGELLKEIAGENESFHLIITAGGDGTSLEVLQSLYHASPALRSKFAILRLPLGTGNDGAEAWEPEDALKLLINPTRTELSRGLKLSTASGKTWPSGDPFLAFNILSVGLDAFVTHMTNIMKGKLPGDSYKLWVDIAALLYDRIYKVSPMEIRSYDEKNHEIKNIREKLLLCAMGVSGRRSYGSHKMILPDDRNVCAITQMSLFRKIVLKELFSSGGHAEKPETLLFNASRIEIAGSNPILAQMDGETVRLEKQDFPAVIELTDPVIPVLRFAK